jgi:FkbM family methyltransferase
MGLASERGTRSAPTAIDWDTEDARLRSVLLSTLTRGDVFVDIGANRGVFAIPIAEHLGITGRVLAFEPASDAVHECRLEAAARHVLDRISVYQVALGAETHTGLLRADAEHPEDSTKRSLFIDGPIVEEVAVYAFDELLDSRIITLDGRLDAVKIDVEGAELDVLTGMQAALQLYRPGVIVVETIERHLKRAQTSTTSVVRFLNEIRYSLIDSSVTGLTANSVFVPTG